MAKNVPAARLSIELVAEIARLQTELDKAKKIVASASGDIARSAKGANDNLAGISKGMAATAPSAKAAAFGMRNLAFQAQDLGVQLASAAGSSDPLRMALMAFVQQGPQIRDAFKQTGQSVLGLVGGFVRAHPILTAAGVAAGVTAGAFKLFGAEIEKSAGLDRYAASLGLAAKEMEKLEGVGITTTDVFKGLWRTIDSYLGLSKVFTAVKTWAVDAFKTALGWVSNFAAGAYAAFMGTAKAAVSMAQAAKQALTGDFAGALATVQNIPDGYTKAFADAKKAMGAFFADVKTNTVAAARERLDGQAAKLIGDRAEAKMKKEAKEKGSLLGDILSGAFLAQFSLQMQKNPIIDVNAIMKDGGQLRDQIEEIDRVNEGKQRLKDAEDYMDQRARDRFMRGANDFADIVGGRLGRAISQLADLFNRAIPDLTKSLGESLGGIGGKLGNLMKGVGLGASAAGAVGGSAVGGAIGGGLGQAAGTALAPMLGQLGAFAGPLGAIAGGILGGVVGGLLKKTKKASATIEIMAGNAMQTSLIGNSSKLKKVAGAMADSLIGGLSGIADQLGGMLGDGIKVSIGQRKDTFRVDLQGLGRTKNMPSFKTEEEAVAFAIQQVIQQGAIIGLRAGTETLLKGEGDLQAQLQKALSFENVFRDLAQRANPTIAAIDAIAKEFADLIDIFDEAKASTEDYAKLQELMAIKQREAIEAAFEPIRTMLDDLKAKADSAGDAVRTAFEAVISRETEAVQAYQAAVERVAEAQRQDAIRAADKAREAFNAGQKRWLDMVTTGFTEEIARIKDAIGPLRDEASALAQTAERLRDFSAGLAGDMGSKIRFSAGAATAAAQAGDLSRLGALRDAAMSGATDRFSQVRNLAILRNAANGAAGGFAGRASGIEGQIALMEQQVGGIERQIELAKSQVVTLEKIEDATASGVEDIAALLADMQSAKSAADLAREQMAKLTELAQTELSFSDAVAAYEAAKAERDNLIRDITAAGFADLIAVQQQTGAQLLAVVSDAAARAGAASSAAAQAIALAQAAQVANVNDNMWNTYDVGYGAQTYRGASSAQPASPEAVGKAVAAELKPALFAIAKYTSKSADTLDGWDVAGQPETRVA